MQTKIAFTGALAGTITALRQSAHAARREGVFGSLPSPSLANSIISKLNMRRNLSHRQHARADTRGNRAPAPRLAQAARRASPPRAQRARHLRRRHLQRRWARPARAAELLARG